MADTRRSVGRLPDLSREWLEVAPDMREFLNSLQQILNDSQDEAGDVGSAIAFFMGSTFAGASGAWGGAGAPITVEYLVGAADGTLTSERVVTATGTITWDLATASQAKADVVAESDQLILAGRIFGG